MNAIVIKGKSILFRMITSDSIHNGWLDWVNNRNLTEYLEISGSVSEDSLIQYLEDSLPPKVYMFAIYDNKTDDYIGNARLSSIDYDKNEAAYGRLIGNSNYHGKGLGTEVLILLSKFAFNKLGLKKIYTGVNSKNIASIKSNIKAGASINRIEKKKDIHGRDIEVTFFSFNNNQT
jgi:ribosomal-protein-alanine N-acetyltransferase